MTASSTPAWSGVTDAARDLLRGAIDIHVHAAPDPYTPRRLDALTLARRAAEPGMAGIVLKSHEYPTQPLAWAVEQAVRLEGHRLRVYGGLALDHGVGGLNPEAVRVSLGLGARIVWMPTFDAAHWRRFRPSHPARGVGIAVLDDAGALHPACHEILDLLRDHDAVLASGHLGVAETLTLFAEAQRRNVRRVVTHASFWFPAETQRDLAASGAYLEQCAIAVLGAGGGQDFNAIGEQVRAAGPARTILSTDLGQAGNPDPPLGFALWIDRFLRAGFAPADLRRMVQDNPRALLD